MPGICVGPLREAQGLGRRQEAGGAGQHEQEALLQLSQEGACVCVKRDQPLSRVLFEEFK